ncbi:EamA family transporter [Nonomuraea jabiensis]|uniref:Drug/metabolite transporter (DMT)-like permease n=1 Tax=Nonomuraea jabiensis TaxID=882448 RepID=A0A7W9LAA9_9ACTN|nr:EamA family transporter [Nonomuraea jabiensis]MBB5776278.1 drug/metabolite transporter (DMT)-like permease [Nonomuraea jabiensis]
MRTDTTDSRPTVLIWGALAVVYVVWGSTYLGIGVAIESIPPMLSGALRFITAAALLAGFLLIRSGPSAFKMSRRQFLGAAVVGVLLLTTGNGLLAVAEQYISTGLAALLVASVPLWLVVFRFAVRDRPKALTLAGVLVGLGGVAALSLTGADGGSGVGIVTVLLGSVSWAVGSFLSSRIQMPANALATSAVEMVVGGAGLLVLGTGVGERLDVSAVTTRSWVALAYLILVGSLIGFTAFSWLLGNAPISLVSTYAYVNPAVAVALGALLLDEPITTQVVVGGLVILAGVALVISTERKGPKRVLEDVDGGGDVGLGVGGGQEPQPARHHVDPTVERRGG